MACIYGIEQPCEECRMCGKGQEIQTVDIGKIREILFRAKRMDNGEWVEGLPMYSVNKSMKGIIDRFLILQDGYYNIVLISPETIGQYTGLTDKNGRKIFEGDIVRDIFNASVVGIVRYGEYRNTFNDDKHGGHAGFYVEWKEKQDLLRKDLVYWVKNSEFIGNIFDNPDSMKG